MKKSRWRFAKNKWFWISLALLLILVLYLWMKSGSSAPTFETAVAQIGDVIETVSVTGTISPVDKADLAFEKSGAVAVVYVKVGDTVKRGDAIAALDSASDRAALASTQATLADISRGLTSQELGVQKTALANAKGDATNAAHDALAKAQAALFNYTDLLFSSPQSSNPVLSIHADSYTTQIDLGNKRLNATTILNSWAADLSILDSDPATLVGKARTYLSGIKSFMTDLSVAVSALSTANSGMTQAAINTDTAAMNAGLSAVNSAIDSVTAAQSALSSAQSAYDLKLSGNSSQSIAAQAAKVAQAQAFLDEDTLSSPIDGVVTRADPNVGEFVAAGSSGFAVQNSSFKIEAYVPEADIAKLAVGNTASSTLDAYGSYVDFPAAVTAIAPAETVLEGVPTYKVTLMFTEPDSRIRSGMTANLEILTHVLRGVLAIPYRAVVDDNGAKSVRVVSADGKTYSSVPVTVGLKGSAGTIEVLSGLSEGQKVVTYVK